jgi:hypothetical protein
LNGGSLNSQYWGNDKLTTMTFSITVVSIMGLLIRSNFCNTECRIFIVVLIVKMSLSLVWLRLVQRILTSTLHNMVSKWLFYSYAESRYAQSHYGECLDYMLS